MQTLILIVVSVAFLALCVYLARLVFKDDTTNVLIEPEKNSVKPEQPTAPSPEEEEEELAKMARAILEEMVARAILEGIWAQADFDELGRAGGVHFSGPFEAYEASNKALIEADRIANEDAYALAVSGKLFVDPKPVGAPTFKKPKKKKTTKKKPAKRSKK